MLGPRWVTACPWVSLGGWRAPREGLGTAQLCPTDLGRAPGETGPPSVGLSHGLGSGCSVLGYLAWWVLPGLVGAAWCLHHRAKPSSAAMTSPTGRAGGMRRSFSWSLTSQFGMWDPHPSTHKTLKPFSAGPVPAWSLGAPSQALSSSFPPGSWVLLLQETCLRRLSEALPLISDVVELMALIC